MKLNAHPRYSAYKAWCDQHRVDAIRIAGAVCYRVAGPTYVTAPAIIEGIGAYCGGGRWNPPEVMNIVYLSRQPETALFEANEHRRHFNLPIWEGMPKVVVAVRVQSKAVLDLTQLTISAALPEPMSALLAEDWRAVMDRGDEATPQALGRAAYEAGLEGLIVPSRPDPSGINLLIFPQRLARGCSLDVLNPKELSKLGE